MRVMVFHVVVVSVRVVVDIHQLFQKGVVRNRVKVVVTTHQRFQKGLVPVITSRGSTELVDTLPALGIPTVLTPTGPGPPPTGTGPIILGLIVLRLLNEKRG